jgi:glucose/arabinose dehydrogenase
MPRNNSLFRSAAPVAALAATVSLFAACRAANTNHVDAANANHVNAVTTVPTSNELLTGKAAVDADTTGDKPGLRFHITVDDLPPPYATPSAGNDARLIPRPDDAWPQAPEGFTVDAFATGLRNPRKIITAPNGDLFVAESGANRVHVFRPGDNGKPATDSVFAGDLRAPFGMAFYPAGPDPQWLYVANTDSVVRYPYHNGDLKATGAQQMLVDNISGGGRLRGGGHWTRDIVFSKDGKNMFVSVGSRSNVEENDDLIEIEKRRARIFEFNPDGTGEQVYATGIRNPVGLAINPSTGQLWTSVNERDGLGDNLVPDYITHVEPGGFYGWPWYYIGNHPDERARGEHPDLSGKVIVPDVLLQSHYASLAMIFYTGGQFPREYDGDVFAAEHGSWNRARRVGYNVIRVFMRRGKATGVYQDFLTGFVTPDGHVWGRPVGVTQGKDGSLYVTDDGTNTIWHVRYTGKK